VTTGAPANAMSNTSFTVAATASLAGCATTVARARTLVSSP
jgi:hypothetical protein